MDRVREREWRLDMYARHEMVAVERVLVARTTHGSVDARLGAGLPSLRETRTDERVRRSVRRESQAGGAAPAERIDQLLLGVTELAHVTRHRRRCDRIDVQRREGRRLVQESVSNILTKLVITQRLGRRECLLHEIDRNWNGIRGR